MLLSASEPQRGWALGHSRGGTGTAFPSPHSLPGAGNIFPSRSRRHGHLEGWRDRVIPAGKTLPPPGFQYPVCTALALLQLGCLLALVPSMPIAGCPWAPASLPRALWAATTCACHLSALTTSLCPPPPPPSDSSPVSEHTWPALAPGLLRACLSLCLGSRTLLPRGIGQLLPHLFQVFAQMSRYYLG